MTKTTPTLTQSGLLAVLLARQHRKASQRARRRARARHVRDAILSAFSTLNGSSRLAIAPPVILMSRGWRNCSTDWLVAFGREENERNRRTLKRDNATSARLSFGRDSLCSVLQARYG